MVANDIDLIINVSRPIDALENAFHQLLEIKRGNTTAHRKYVTTAVKLKPIATTAKMDVALKSLPRSKARVAPFGRLLRLSFLY
jgi:hypothetical protein